MCRMAPSLRQIGFKNKVWKLGFALPPTPPLLQQGTSNDQAEAKSVRVLAPYDSPSFPEALLVIRT